MSVTTPRNALAFCFGGQVVSTYFKYHLPNYGVFDEARYFVPGTQFEIVRFRGFDVALAIGEDLWQEGGPFMVAGATGVGLVVNINASPFERDKDAVRLPLLRRRAREAGAIVTYVNTGGGQDELVFDGDSIVVSADGAVLLRAPQYVAGIHLIDLALPLAVPDPAPPPAGLPMTVHRHDTGTPPAADRPTAAGSVADRLGDEAEVWGALVTGTRDYTRKNGFRSVVLGLSGGIDSAVVATIARDALGPENVHVIGMPSRFSSEHSVGDAEELAKRQGLQWQLIP